jgi:hypothetical protein
MDEEAKKKLLMAHEKFMTDEEIKRTNTYVGQLNDVKGEMQHLYSEWADIETYYQNNQTDVTDMPNSKINIINSNIEGQTALIVEQNMAIMTRGESADDENYAKDARVGLEWTLRKNYFRRVEKSYVRRLLKYGNSVFSLFFDPDALNKFGLVKIHSSSLSSIFIDGKIKDFHRYQEAEYIAEAITLSKTQFEDIYGEEKANSVSYGSFPIDDKNVFNVDDSNDDEDAATLIRRWSRHKGKLRLEEFSGDGLLLYDSHKKGKRKDNQKKSEYEHKSYYKYVNDKYPYFFTVLYAREGNFWGFGDGKLLMPLQKLINELYDKIRICARPNLIMYDTNSEVDLSDYNENSLEPRPYDGTNVKGTQPVHSVAWGTINESWWRLLASIHQEVQRVTRFADLMTGQKGQANTATEASIQQQQGNAATDDKKRDIQTTMQEMLEYALGLMMEFYTEGRSFRDEANKDDYNWIDFRQFANVPAKIPASTDFQKKFKEQNPDKEVPKWELLTDSKGDTMTKNVDLDIEVTIGAGLPKNKAFITQFMQQIAKVVLPDKQMQSKPAIYWEEFRTLLKDYIGIPIEDDELQGIMSQPMPQGQPQQPQQNPNAPLGANGGPQMAPLNQIRGGA